MSDTTRKSCENGRRQLLGAQSINTERTSLTRRLIVIVIVTFIVVCHSSCSYHLLLLLLLLLVVILSSFLLFYSLLLLLSSSSLLWSFFAPCSSPTRPSPPNSLCPCPPSREILMTASPNIKTPTMDIPLKPGKKALKKAKELQKKFTKVHLSHVNSNLFVCENIFFHSSPGSPELIPQLFGWIPLAYFDC